MRVDALIIGCLAVWRVTHLVNAEDGPFDVVVRLRVLAGTGMAGKLMDCFYCLSLWIAIPFALVLEDTLQDRALLWLALSGGAGLLQRFSSSGTSAADGAQTGMTGK
ncbi:MAG: DUF1360 domain-containing protein [Deltaproteobacteria bacterium]|nr:MAG: DUF1360 domain-containing protein [Deltaproteobacteria bacterium]TMQ12125.1 MAG: DUF1360 domain-containing protein [Deltaproteobacteria bacterium]